LWPPILKRAPGRLRERCTNQPQKEDLEEESHDTQDADSLDIWQKHAVNMYMIMMPHHLLLQSQRKSEARKVSP
jgi:hypothetical protein